METQNAMTELKCSLQAAESGNGACGQEDPCVQGRPEELPQRGGPGQRGEKGKKKDEKYR